MTHRLTASALALSIAFSGLSVTPVQAGNNNDLGRLVAGAIVLFAIGKAIEDNNRDRNRAGISPAPQPVKKPKRVKRHVPDECYFQLRTDRGSRGVYGKTCLSEMMRHADRLPQSCADTVRVRYGRNAEVYSAQCLKDHGYQVASNRY
ncbi:MAG: hypothetical protein V3U96_00680 [Paracoccaceae bacterium]